MELIVDPEFRDLIPPLTEEEYKGLEDSLLTDGYDETLPIIVWKGQGIVVDGHNRYGICQKHNIPFVTVEHEFESRYEVVKWMLDRQLDRRSPNKKKRTYVIGRRYLVEKGESVGRPTGSKELPQNGVIKKLDSTSKLIGAQLGIGKNTVERAAEFTEAVDRIVQVTRIKVNDLLDDKIGGSMDDIKKLADSDIDFLTKAMKKVTEDRYDIHSAMFEVDRDEMDRRIREAEEKKKQMEEKLRLEREEKEKQDRERLRIEREEKEMQESIIRERERAEKERLRLANLERERILAEEKAKNDAERERIRKERAEKERIERAKIEAERNERLKIENERLAKLRIEQERIDEERLAKARIEQEKIDKQKIEEIDKDLVIRTSYDPYIKCAYKIMGGIDLDAYVCKDRLYRLNVDKSDSVDSPLAGKVWLDALESGKDVSKLVDNLISCYKSGDVKDAFVITKNETDATWFMNMMYTANAVIFPVSIPKSQLKSHALIYFGECSEMFMRECEQFGWGIVLNK